MDEKNLAEQGAEIASFTDWVALGFQLRVSALDAHDNVLPPIDIAYEFLRDNPECFVGPGEVEAWPFALPENPPAELVVAYYGYDPDEKEHALQAAADSGDAIALFALVPEAAEEEAEAAAE